MTVLYKTSSQLYEEQFNRRRRPCVGSCNEACQLGCCAETILYLIEMEIVYSHYCRKNKVSSSMQNKNLNNCF